MATVTVEDKNQGRFPLKFFNDVQSETEEILKADSNKAHIVSHKGIDIVKMMRKAHLQKPEQINHIESMLIDSFEHQALQ